MDGIPEPVMLGFMKRGYVQVHLRYGLKLCQLGTYDPLLPERRSLELPG